jgi:2,4-dienoyl-CoA reductase-like NADH-dependent reductase (Old Yellow Enzyme family)
MPRAAEAVAEGQPAVAAAQLRKVFKGPIIAAGGFDRDGAEKIISNGDADMVAFGRHFAANPDLVERFRKKCAAQPLRPQHLLRRRSPWIYRLSVLDRRNLSAARQYDEQYTRLFTLKEIP